MSHNTSHGWIKLHRELLAHPLWLNSTAPQRVILVTLLMLANHAERKWEWQGRPYTCKPGQLITSMASLRKKCGPDVTIQNVRSALKRLEMMGFLNKQSNTHSTLITICRWEHYQNDNTAAHTTDNALPTDTQHRANARLTTNKNDKECKNERTPLTPQRGAWGEDSSSKGKQTLSAGALRLLRQAGMKPEDVLGGDDE